MDYTMDHTLDPNFVAPVSYICDPRRHATASESFSLFLLVAADAVVLQVENRWVA